MNYISRKFRIWRRARKIKKLKKKIPPYLLKDFEVELNYKLWSTKGSRFLASRRNDTLHKLSTRSIGMLSAYLIIVNIINIYNIDFLRINLTDNEVGFISTAISILILLFSQLEGSENFIVRAQKFHDCGLEISELYNKLRYIKTYEFNLETKKDELQKLSSLYDLILKKYENHSDIDYKKFLIQKSDYHELSLAEVWNTKLKYFFKVKFRYLLLIYGPIILFVINWFFNKPTHL